MEETYENTMQVKPSVESWSTWEQEHGVSVGAASLLPSGFAVGNAQDTAAGTGCTVLLCKAGAVGGVAVEGAAPATRETEVLRSENAVECVHGVILSGGSAFGLDAATGAMQFLAEQGAGVAFGGRTIPIVVGASLFDLVVGSAEVTPDAAMGYQAARNTASATDSALDAAAGNALGSTVGAVGNIGAGTGASVGKMLGPEFSMKGGLGAASITQDDLTVSAVVAVNALGCVSDPVSGARLAGVLDPQTAASDTPKLLDPYVALELFAQSQTGEQPNAQADKQPNAQANGNDAQANSNTNTTIGCILTNARLTKPQANRVALMAHDGLARTITPVHTSFDGDAVFCMASGEVAAHPDVVGSLAALCMERAIVNAVVEAQSAYGLLAFGDV
ncbi:MAG: P1 family peptidase [Coriobacteriia bacterium]|nr:P1 family peptidase [Coriobacteriia bacterium]